MKVGIVGLGLIGGSIARDLKAKGHELCGYDQNPIHCEKALDLGLVNRIVEIDTLALDCDAIFVSIPVDITPDVLIDLLDRIRWSTVLMDTGSTKESICKAVSSHTKRSRFVACHPLAGTEFSGPTAAITGLFDGKKNIICEEESSDEDAVQSAIMLFSELGMTNLFMNPADHDKHMAYVSHLSHVSAFMLGSTVLDIEKDEKQIFNLASTGFQSTVRLAKSSPETWSKIFCDNNDNILAALDSYIAHLNAFKHALELKDINEMKRMIEKSNEIKRVLNGMKYNVVKLS
jgi:prephenate dehydrogenase